MRKRLATVLGKNGVEKIRPIPLQKIKPNPFQLRQNYDEQQLIDLARSILSCGLIQPIIVRPWGRFYQIVAGERRFQAFYILGRSHIPARILDIDDNKVIMIALSENLQRKDLSYGEETYGYNLLNKMTGMSTDEMSRMIGCSPMVIADKLRLFKLPEHILDIVTGCKLTEKHVRALLKINPGSLQEEVLKQIQERKLTALETEELVDKINNIKFPGQRRGNRTSRNVSIVIRDARIFINTIKETVKRARQTGIDILMMESDTDEHYEVVIRVKKHNHRINALA